MGNTPNFADLLRCKVEHRIEDNNKKIQDVYKQIQNILTSSDFDKSFSAMKFASMEKELIGRMVLDTETWFRENVKGSAANAGMSELDAELYWSKVYYDLPSSMPEISYIDIADIDAIICVKGVGRSDGQKKDKRAGKREGLKTKDQKAEGLKVHLIGKFTPQAAVDQGTETEETCINETKLREICKKRKRIVSECLEKWIEHGRDLAIKAWPEQ